MISNYRFDIIYEVDQREIIWWRKMSDDCVRSISRRLIESDDLISRIYLRRSLIINSNAAEAMMKRTVSLEVSEFEMIYCISFNTRLDLIVVDIIFALTGFIVYI